MHGAIAESAIELRRCPGAYREALEIVIDTTIPTGRVVRTMEQLRLWRGLPKAIRLDNGPGGLRPGLRRLVCGSRRGAALYPPGKPHQNAFIERFNRTYREEVLNAHLFETLNQVREVTYRWLPTYTEVRPHDSLGRVPPVVFRRRLELENSTFGLST